MSCGPTNRNCCSNLELHQVKHSAFMAVSGAAALVGSFVYRPWAQHGPILCPMRALLGVPCPGCGLTRSFCSIASGDLRRAFGYHLFGPFLFAMLLIGVPVLAYQALTRRRVPLFQELLFAKRPAMAFA